MNQTETIKDARPPTGSIFCSWPLIGRFFAESMGRQFRAGPLRCLFCGSPCDGSETAKTWLKDNFTAMDTLVCPGSSAVCDGCSLAMSGSVSGLIADNERREGRAAQCRLWSWIIGPSKALAGSKKMLAKLRESCLFPPEPPYAIVITDGGQRHLIYMAKVCTSSEVATVCFDGANISYRPLELSDRLDVCRKLIAATGKPALSEGLSRRQRLDIGEQLGIDVLREWDAVNGSPLTALAVWLSPGKEECIRGLTDV